jgi:hypothetical protein
MIFASVNWSNDMGVVLVHLYCSLVSPISVSPVSEVASRSLVFLAVINFLNWRTPVEDDGTGGGGGHSPNSKDPECLWQQPTEST